MQAINRIQNVVINANAAVQGAMVIDSANAHRAYLKLFPCDSGPVSKSPGTTITTGIQASSSGDTTSERLSKRSSVELRTSGPVVSGNMVGMWRLQSHHNHMPATMWAMLVLNHTLCG